jgi:hypothetical protein
MKKHQPDHPPVVLDKHLDEKSLSILFASAVRTAKTARPQSAYEGDHPDDEDFTHVLQLAWEDYALVITADGAFFEKAQHFQDELRKRKKDRCLRGVLIVPKQRDEQVRLLRAFIDGTLEVRCKGRPGGEVVTLSEVSTLDLGVDFREKVPRAVELCKCEWDE